MNEKRPGRLQSFNRDGVWKQCTHHPKTLNEDGLLDYEPFTIKRENGLWFVTSGAGMSDADWIPVREDIAKVIVVGIEAERRMKERRGEWEMKTSYPMDVDEDGNDIYGFDGTQYVEHIKTLLLPETYTKFYCHAVLQRVLKMKRGSDENEADKIYRSIQGFEFAAADSYDALARQPTGMNVPMIGRIAKSGTQTNKDLNMFTDVHSFLVLGRDSRGNYLCFEKADSYENPVRLNTLRHIYDHHSEYRFAFQAFDSVVEQVAEMQVGLARLAAPEHTEN